MPAPWEIFSGFVEETAEDVSQTVGDVVDDQGNEVTGRIPKGINVRAVKRS